MHCWAGEKAAFLSILRERLKGFRLKVDRRMAEKSQAEI
jgi:hypothetical protein